MIRGLWPKTTPLTWRDKFDLACLVGYNDMTDARQLAGIKRLEAEARAADSVEDQLWRQGVPVRDLLNANTVRFDKQHLAKLRHQIVDAYRREHLIPAALTVKLRREQEGASVDARLLDLSICGNVDPTLE